jgi:hypothetical protein
VELVDLNGRQDEPAVLSILKLSHGSAAALSAILEDVSGAVSDADGGCISCGVRRKPRGLSD